MGQWVVSLSALFRSKRPAKPCQGLVAVQRWSATVPYPPQRFMSALDWRCRKREAMREAEMFAIDGELQRERARKDLQAERDTLKADCHELLRQRDQLLSAAKAAQHKIQMTLRVSDNEGTEWG